MNTIGRETVAEQNVSLEVRRHAAAAELGPAGIVASVH